jgi:hypothetical protein
LFTLVQTWVFKQPSVRRALNIQLADPKIMEEKERERAVDAEFRMFGYISTFRKLASEGPMMKRLNQITTRSQLEEIKR